MYGEMSSVPMENVTGAIWSSRCSKLQCTMSMRSARNTNARTYPYLIRPACLGQVSHPFDALIVTLLEDLQETHDQARRCEHEHLEVDIDGRSRPDLSSCRAGQLSMRGEGDFLSALYARNSTAEENVDAWLVKIFGSAHFHTTTFSAGTYFAFPFATLQSTFVVFSGVGILITTLVAESLLLKFVFTVTTYCTCVVPISVTEGITFSGSLTLDVARYLHDE